MRALPPIIIVFSFALGCGSRPATSSDTGSSDHTVLVDGAGTRDSRGPSEAPVVSSCSSNQQCQPSSYCSLASGCTGTGQCKIKPTACDKLLAPVCGCDGKDYGNSCMAAAAGVNIAHTGSCKVQGVTIITDNSTYQAQTPVKATLINGTASSIFLTGCFSFLRERLEDGAWVDYGGSVVCGWEGIAIEVKAGAQREETVYMPQGGTWRLKAVYGVGCTPGKPLSAALCSSMGTAFSSPFTVLPEAKTCTDFIAKYSSAMTAAKTCNLTEPVLHCTFKVDFALNCPSCTTFVESPGALLTLAKQWKNSGCASLPNQPTCPPMACAPKSGSCVNGQCQDVN